MESFELNLTEIVPGIPVAVFKGYLAAEGGAKLMETVEPLLQSGKVKVVLDFKDCKVISSPGIAALIDLVMLINDDFKGKCIISGLDNSKTMFLKMTGVLPLAETSASAEEASNALKT